MAIPIARPSIKRKDMDSVLSCMVSDTIGPDRVSKQFTEAVGEYLDRRKGIALREYPRAAAVALDTLELQPGSRVVASPLLPALYGEVFERLGLEFLPAEVAESAPVVTPETVQAAAPDGAEALIVDTTLGYAPDLEGLSNLGIPMIEDVSQGLGAHTGERRAGTVGRYTLVGLEPEHIITAGGGALVLAAGRQQQSALKTRGDNLLPEVLLPDVNSALGLTQIKEIERYIEKRRELAGQLSRAVSEGRHRTPVQPGDGENVFYSFPLVLETGMKEVIAYARKHEVEAVAAFSNSILARTPELEEKYPIAHSYYLRCVRFPLYPLLRNSETERITRVLSTLP